MGSNPRNAVTVPTLSGGVNLEDALHLVDDNQLTDCKNVWYKDGFLQTRPGLKNNPIDFDDFGVEVEDGALEHFFVQNDVYIDDILYKVEWVINGTNAKINFYCTENVVNASKHFEITEDTFTGEMQQGLKFLSLAVYNGKPTIDINRENGTIKGKGVYIYATFEGDYVFLFELVDELVNDKNTEKFQFIEPGYLYSPEVYLNGKSEQYAELPADVKAEYAMPTLYEGYSAISNAWSRYEFTTDAEGNSFVLPDSYVNCLIQFEYTDPRSGGVRKSGSFKIEPTSYNNDGSVKEWDIYDKDGNVVEYGTVFKDVTGTTRSGSVSAVEDGDISFSVDAIIDKRIHFWIKKEFVEKLEATDKEYYDFCFRNALGVTTNNLVVKLRPIPATYADKTARKSNLPRMKIADTFGSASKGVHGGSRIFVAGSSGKRKSLLAWSDVNNPTYFSENNYVYVGNTSSQITAIEKQENMLVIFKKGEMFYTVAAEGTDYTYESLKAGGIVDVSTLDNTFPIIQISSTVGCDKPYTVRLCGNRLVWADGNQIYMLRSANQYSNVNVSVISNMLGTLELSVNSSAVAYKGYYVLLSQNKLYLLNYDQYYFNSLPSYSDTKKANRKLQWHIWEAPKRGYGRSLLISDNESLAIYSVLFGEDEYKNLVRTTPMLFAFNEEKNTDDVLGETTEQAIESVVQTKMFNFGSMERFKSIEQMYVGFGKDESNVRIEYLTESGTLSEIAFPIDHTDNLNSPKFIKTKRFLPCVKRALSFGVRFTATGKFVLDSILIKFKYMGAKR